VPGFIKRIATGDERGSAMTILDANILGSSCARVCPTEVLCEGACVLNDLHVRPIQIGRLQGYATDPVVLSGEQVFAAAPATGHRVAVVGAGPSGLACAAELTRLGHEVVVYEADEAPGGLNTHGVADYKLDRSTSLAEVAWVAGMGVEILTGTRVAIEDLVGEFDAVFAGVGLGAIQPLQIPGEDLPGSEDALAFIRRLKSSPRSSMSLEGERVAVIGGGNTAIDAATQSARLGADKVYLVYRRGRDEMRAYDHEVELALGDGVEFIFWSAPLQVEGTDAITGLVCGRTELVNGTPKPVEDSEFTLGVTKVLRATGQQKQQRLFQGVDGIALDDGGRVIVDDGFRTGHPKVWAGGDCVNGGQEVVNAVAHGRDAARNIHEVFERDGS
jgi:glutamate synthase (NADPH/NADH) small chain